MKESEVKTGRRISTTGGISTTGTGALATCAVLCLCLSLQADEQEESAKTSTASAQQVLGEELVAIAADGSVEAVLDAAAHAVSDRLELLGTQTPQVAQALGQELRNIESSRRLLETLEAIDDPLLRAVELARVGTRLRAEQLGLELPNLVDDASSATPAELALMVAARHTVSVTDEQLEVLYTLDALDDPKRLALAQTLHAYLAFDAAAREPGADYHPEVAPLVSPNSNLGQLIAARIALAESSVALRDAFDNLEPRSGALSPPIVDLCPALAIDPLGTNTDYPDDCALIIDVAGNDNYDNNAGGSDFLGIGCSGLTRGAAALLDLLGDDEYGDGSGRSCGVNGGGHSASAPVLGLGITPGVGFLLDAQGEDTYIAAAFGTNGGGYGNGGVGIGFLLDATGNDDYIAGDHGTNGGGQGELGIGLGFLVDGEGDDEYDAGSFGTNGGGASTASLGHGFLLDVGGGDDYDGGSYGTNGGGCSDPFRVSELYIEGASAGFLFDVEEQIGPTTTTFDAGIQGANGGACSTGGDIEARSSAVGFLLHHGFGSTTFTASSGGTNGGAVGDLGIAVGLLIALGSGGNDYVASRNGTNGGAYGDFGVAVGFLLDADGHDDYSATTWGTNGGAFVPARAMSGRLSRIGIGVPGKGSLAV